MAATVIVSNYFTPLPRSPNPIKGWYFSTKEKKLRFGDNRFISLGETHAVPKPVPPEEISTDETKNKSSNEDTKQVVPTLCCAGLHASVNIVDALLYAPSSILYRVEIGGYIVSGLDKMTGSERTYLYGGISISNLLRSFMCKVALDASDYWEIPDVVQKYLTSVNETLRPAALAKLLSLRDATEHGPKSAMYACLDTMHRGTVLSCMAYTTSTIVKKKAELNITASVIAATEGLGLSDAGHSAATNAGSAASTNAIDIGTRCDERTKAMAAIEGWFPTVYEEKKVNAITGEGMIDTVGTTSLSATVDTDWNELWIKYSGWLDSAVRKKLKIPEGS